VTTIRSRSVEFATPWFELIAKRKDGDDAPFYSLRQADYVVIVAFTGDDELLLVRQFRPAIEGMTLELPSGLVEEGTSRDAAMRELIEETGYAAETMTLLNDTFPDIGRLQNRMWCYLAQGCRPLPGAIVEEGIEVVRKPRHAVAGAVRSGEISCALHIAALYFHDLARSAATPDAPSAPA
jgi:ADP-ribose pyrophosphatase